MHTCESSVSDVEHEAWPVAVWFHDVTLRWRRRRHLLPSCLSFFPSILLSFHLLGYTVKTTISQASTFSLCAECYHHRRPHTFLHLHLCRRLLLLFFVPLFLLHQLISFCRRWRMLAGAASPSSSTLTHNKGWTLPDFSSLLSASCFGLCLASSLGSSCRFSFSSAAIGAAAVSALSFSVSSLPSSFWTGDTPCGFSLADEEICEEKQRLVIMWPRVSPTIRCFFDRIAHVSCFCADHLCG